MIIATSYFWFFMMGILFFLLWVFYGGKDHKFIGLAPLSPEYELKPEELETIDPDISVELEEEREYAKMESMAEERKSNLPEIIEQNQGYRQRSRGETICKRCLETWFKVSFGSERPSFLKNPYTGMNLELDCYNKSFKLAVEYNGIQHYVFPNRYMKEESELLEQIKKDEFKMKMCNKNGVHLIIVPYTTKESEIPEFIRRKLPPHLRNLATEEIKIE